MYTFFRILWNQKIWILFSKLGLPRSSVSIRHFRSRASKNETEGGKEKKKRKQAWGTELGQAQEKSFKKKGQAQETESKKQRGVGSKKRVGRLHGGGDGSDAADAAGEHRDGAQRAALPPPRPLPRPPLPGRSPAPGRQPPFLAPRLHHFLLTDSDRC